MTTSLRQQQQQTSLSEYVGEVSVGVSVGQDDDWHKQAKSCG